MSSDRGLSVGEGARGAGGASSNGARLQRWGVLSTGSSYAILANTACGVRLRPARMGVGKGYTPLQRSNGTGRPVSLDRNLAVARSLRSPGVKALLPLAAQQSDGQLSRQRELSADPFERCWGRDSSRIKRDLGTRSAAAGGARWAGRRTTLPGPGRQGASDTGPNGHVSSATARERSPPQESRRARLTPRA